MISVRRLLRALLATLAAAVIVLALGLGSLKILLSQLPGYQQQLEARIGDALGVELDFERMDARLGLNGPELTFHEASMTAPGDDEPFIVARRAVIVVDLWALVEREMRARRLTFDGTHLAFVRRDSGRLELQGAPAGGDGVDFALLFPADVELAVRDGRLDYADPSRGIDWSFSDVALDLVRHDGVLEADFRASPPASLGERIEVAVRRSLAATGAHRAAVIVRDGSFAAVAAALPPLAGLPNRGRGDLSAIAEWNAGELVSVAATAELAGVEWSGAAGGGYDYLAVGGEWRSTENGWGLEVQEIDVRRGELVWAADAALSVDVALDAAGQVDTLAAAGRFLRLEDLAPIVAALPVTPLTTRWLEHAPRGDMHDFDLGAERTADGFDYRVAARFDDLGLDAHGRWPRVDGLSGALRADADSGRLDLDAHGAELDWPQWFRGALPFDRLTGLVVWREGADVMRVVSEDVAFANADGSVRASLELAFPLGGGPPEVDLRLETGAFDATAIRRYIPAVVMPPPVVRWVDDAIEGGRILGMNVEFSGPLAAFPFDDGEGRFHATADVSNGVLEYAPGWPRAEELTGRIEFDNAGLSARGRGRVFRNVGEDVVAGIADMRRPELTIAAASRGPLADVLAFLREAPQIATHLGPGYDRLDAPAGEAAVELDLALPLFAMRDYRLDATLAMTDGVLAVEGFGPQLTDIQGSLRFSDGALTGEAIEATFLEGPVLADVAPAAAQGYRARLALEGEVTAAAVVDAFELRTGRHLAGQTRWRGELLIPSRFGTGATAVPLKIAVASPLAGVASSLPAPLDKRAGDATSLRLDFSIGTDRVDLNGHVGPTRQFALEFARSQERLRLERGALKFGGGALGDVHDRFDITGALPALDIDAWATFWRERGGTAAGPQAPPASGVAANLGVIDLEIGELTALGQSLGPTRLEVDPAPDGWRLALESAPVAGLVDIPRDIAQRGTITARLARLHLAPADVDEARLRPSGDSRRTDPRRLPGIDIAVEDFRFGPRRLGAFQADVRPDPLGLRVSTFASRTTSFAVSGSGTWFAEPGGPSTSLALHLTAADVAAALTDLALEPLASGEMAEITASVHWPGAPNDDWMQHIEGELSLRLEQGSLLDIAPGAGRVVGLMSISALPRRLALDFRDVFNKGLVFDELGGQFTIIDGNAYTDNFKVAGPAAEIGLAGRIGLRDRDYRQQAVITAEPGNMLPTVGGLIGGPGVGAALLIFTRIFKEPLKGIGRASYCITGGWDAPVVERLTAEQLEQGRLCVDLPADAGMASGETVGANE